MYVICPAVFLAVTDFRMEIALARCLDRAAVPARALRLLRPCPRLAPYRHLAPT